MNRREPLRFYVRTFGPLPGTASVGDHSDVYELEVPYVAPFCIPIPPDTPLGDFHAVAIAKGPTMKAAAARLPKDRVQAYRCDCAKGATLVRELKDGQGQRWAVIEPEHVSSAFFQDIRPTSPAAWPLHSEPTGQPHISVTSCVRCRRVWLVLLTATSVKLLKVKAVTHNGRVAP